VLYLAEVKKQSKGFIGGTETKLKLLAFQRNDQSWCAVPGDESINCEAASGFGEGALLLVNLGGNRQVQGTPTLAGARIVSMLQNFARVLDKSKGQEEEIEQWKQSLTYQSQELTRREMEMEARIEQIEQKENELRNLESQRQEIERLKIEAKQIKIDSERQLEEVNLAWSELRTAQTKVETAQKELEKTSVLDDVQANKIRELVNRLDEVLPIESFQREISEAWNEINHQQEFLSYHWQQLEEQKQQAQIQKQRLNEQQQELFRRKQQLQQELSFLEQTKEDYRTQQNLLHSKQEIIKIVNYNLQTIDDLYKNVSALAMQSGDFELESRVDVQALENMPLGELETLVKNLQADLEKFVVFVKDQEDELTLQYEEIQAIKENLNNLNPFDSLSVETDLTEAEEQYKILDSSLIGSRRNLRERQEFLKLHLRILRTRQGVIDIDNDANDIDLKPILSKIDQQKQEQKQAQESLELQIQQIEGAVTQVEALLNTKSNQCQEQKQQIEAEESGYQEAKIVLGAVQASLQLYEELLHPLQGTLNQLKGKLDAIEEFPNDLLNNQQEQAEVLEEMESIINALTGGTEITII
jgi:chromosome segregation ATPase